MAVHARIPWPMQAERDRLPLCDAAADLEHAKRGWETTTKMVEENERLIEVVTAQNRDLRELAMMEARSVATAGERLHRLRSV